METVHDLLDVIGYLTPRITGPEKTEMTDNASTAPVNAVVRLRLPLEFEYSACVRKMLAVLVQRGYYAEPSDICAAYKAYCEESWSASWMTVGDIVSTERASDEVFRRLEVAN